MAKTTISIEISTPTNITIAEAVRLFTNHHNYQETVPNPDYDPEVEGSLPTIANPQNRGEFAKATIARQVKEAIKAQRLSEAQKEITLEGEITAE